MDDEAASVYAVYESFDSEALHPRWQPWTIGTGVLEHEDHTLRCVLHPAADHARAYSDAQITDYKGLSRRHYPWTPPLRLTARAWASHPINELKGTAGFGFWNEPFVPVGSDLPRLPRAVWFFFGSPPNNMALAQAVPGYGWKAATLDTSRWQFLTLAPFAPIGFLLMRLPALYRRLWPVGQRAIGASEALLPVDLIEPHEYTLEWFTDRVLFYVDGGLIHKTPTAPRGPLGFIAWLDNQYAVVTPQGRFRFGLIPVDQRQYLALDTIEIRRL
ncbi:MAG: hypothetical protein JXA10_19410 [Anaerolineae bacterium]|nr:hypothetical protein [Anaerolineae bacterium]